MMNPKQLILPSLIAVLFFFNPQEEQYIEDLSVHLKETICHAEDLSSNQQNICWLIASPIAKQKAVKSISQEFQSSSKYADIQHIYYRFWICEN